MVRGDISLRELSGELDEMAALQRVLEAAPAHAYRMTGAPPGSAEAQSLYTILPEGKTYEDKKVYGVYLGEQMVGCIDVVLGWPDDATAIIGLLLIREDHQGRGIGTAAYGLLEELSRDWPRIRTLRVAVLQSDTRAQVFWEQQGFVPTGDTSPYAVGSVADLRVISEKSRV